MMNTRTVPPAAVTLALLAWGGLAVGGEIHDAVKEGDLREVGRLLQADPKLVSSRSEDDLAATPLHGAAGGGRELVELLLAKGADANATDRNGETPLHVAARAGGKDVVVLLLGHKADVNAKDASGKTPLHLAVTRDLGVVEALLASKADVNARTETGESALHFAAELGRLEVVTALLAHQADANAATTLGLTPVFLAVGNGHAEVVALLAAVASPAAPHPTRTVPARAKVEAMAAKRWRRVARRVMICSLEAWAGCLSAL